MNNDLNELADVLEDEVALGETLCRNLEAQKNALIAWNMADLLAHIEAREAWLRSLGELEQRRSRIVAQSDAFTAAPRLRQVIAALPTQSPDRTRLTRLHEQTRPDFCPAASRRAASPRFDGEFSGSDSRSAKPADGAGTIDLRRERRCREQTVGVGATAKQSLATMSILSTLLSPRRRSKRSSWRFKPPGIMSPILRRRDFPGNGSIWCRSFPHLAAVFLIGQGVDVAGVTSIIDHFAEAELLSLNSDVGYSDAQSRALNSIQEAIPISAE